MPVHPKAQGCLLRAVLAGQPARLAAIGMFAGAGNSLSLGKESRRIEMSDISLLYFLLVLSFFGIVSVPVFQYVKRKRRDIFEPIYLATFVFFMMFWVRSVYVLIWGSPLLGESPFAPDIIKFWNIAWLCLLLACAVFFVAYYSKVGVAVANAFPPLPPHWNVGHAYSVILVLLGVGLGAFSWLVVGYGGIQNFLSRRHEAIATLGIADAELLSYCVALSMQAAYVVLVAHRRGLLLFIFLSLSALGLAVAKGTRMEFFFSLLGILMIRHYLKKRLMFRHLLAGLLLMAFLVSPVFVAVRETRDLSEFSFLGEVDYPGGALAFIERFAGMESLIYIIRDTPEVMEYQLGKTYLVAFVAWIPRRLWNDKPWGFVHVFTPLYLGHVFAPGTTGYAPTIFGEAYVNFHVGGIVLVAALGGIFLRAFHRYLIERNHGLSGIFVYSATLPFLILLLESHIVALLTPAWIFFLTAVSSSLVSGKKLQ